MEVLFLHPYQLGGGPLDTCTEKFPPVSMGGWAGGHACADLDQADFFHMILTDVWTEAFYCTFTHGIPELLNYKFFSGPLACLQHVCRPTGVVHTLCLELARYVNSSPGFPIQRVQGIRLGSGQNLAAVKLKNVSDFILWQSVAKTQC